MDYSAQLRDEFETVGQMLYRRIVRCKEAEKSLLDVEVEFDRLSGEVKTLELVDQTLLFISNKVLGTSVGSIDKLITAGLRLVFDDQSLEFQTETDTKRGKTAIKFKLLQDGREAPIMNAYGGGVLVIVGVLLRAFTTMALGMRRVLFLDESLSHVSDQYIENASRLMRKLCSELDFTIVMITHQPLFAAHADCHYRVEKRDNQTKIRKV